MFCSHYTALLSVTTLNIPAVWPVSVWGPAGPPARPAPAEPGTAPTGISSAALPAGSWSRWCGVCALSSVCRWPSAPPRPAPLLLHQETGQSYITVGILKEICQGFVILAWKKKKSCRFFFKHILFSEQCSGLVSALHGAVCAKKL